VYLITEEYRTKIVDYIKLFHVVAYEEAQDILVKAERFEIDDKAYINYCEMLKQKYIDQYNAYEVSDDLVDFWVKVSGGENVFNLWLN